MKRRVKWFIGGVALVLAVALGVFLYGRLQHARRDARQTMCVHRFKFVATALKMYAEDHEGRYPDTISALFPDYLTELEVFVCPEVSLTCKRERGVPHPFSDAPTPEEIDSLSSYVLVPGLAARDDKDTVIAYEKVDNHFGMGRSLLYLDGRGAWEPPENWRNGPPNVGLPAALRVVEGT